MRHYLREPSRSASRTSRDYRRYRAYQAAVQCPEADVPWLVRTFRSIRKRPPTKLAEDFCGTFALCCEWARSAAGRTAVGVDLDPSPVRFGRAHNLIELTPEQQERVDIRIANVLSSDLPSAEIVCAMNFSYYIFRERKLLVDYFRNVLGRLGRDGIFVLDAFGGPDCGNSHRESKRLPGFTYTWEQKGFDPISNHADFAIHFAGKKTGTIKNAFTYKWRMWTIPEVKDALIDAGFSDAIVYWEGTDKRGRGNGEFTKAKKGEECDVWVAYVVGVA